MNIIKGRLWIKSIFLLLVIGFLSVWHMIISSSVNVIRVINDLNNTYPFPLNTSPLINVHPIERLPKSDYTTLMNITSFEFKILNKCSFVPVLLVLVHTAPNNHERRKAIRETWGNKQAQVILMFMLGSVMDTKVQQLLEKENEEHKDMVQGSFEDAYRNMTYKHVMSLKYAIYHCSDAKYVLKTDDDVFVNMPTMLDFLTIDLPPYGAKRLLSCAGQPKAPVERSYRSKWRVSFSEYAERYYPPYCPGWVILYSADVVFSLYQEVQKAKFFWIDDVLVTGFVREKVNITISDVTGLVLSYDNMKKIISHEMKDSMVPSYLFGPVNLSVKDMYGLIEGMKNLTSSYKSLLNYIR